MVFGQLLKQIKMLPGKDKNGYFTIIFHNKETMYQFAKFAQERNCRIKVSDNDDGTYYLKIKKPSKKRDDTLVEHQMLKGLENLCNDEKKDLQKLHNEVMAKASIDCDLQYAVTNRLMHDAESSINSQKHIIHRYRKRLTKHSL